MTLRSILMCLLLIPAVSCAQSKTPTLEQGVDYQIVENGAPYSPLEGKIEVVEVFGYWCIHCAHFQPIVDQWKRTLPADVRLTYLPAVFQEGDPYARAFFAAEKNGLLGSTHQAVFDAVHRDRALPQNASVDELANFYAQHGANATKFKADMTAPEVDRRLARSRAFALASGVGGTPTLIVNGRYRIEGKSAQDQLRIADALIAKERAAAKTAR